MLISSLDTLSKGTQSMVVHGSVTQNLSVYELRTNHQLFGQRPAHRLTPPTDCKPRVINDLFARILSTRITVRVATRFIHADENGGGKKTSWVQYAKLQQLEKE
jgi:hypothetical protein